MTSVRRLSLTSGETFLLLVAQLFGAFALFNSGPQVATWIYPNELFPTYVRGTAMGPITSGTRISSALGAFLVPILLDGAGIEAMLFVSAQSLAKIPALGCLARFLRRRSPVLFSCWSVELSADALVSSDPLH